MQEYLQGQRIMAKTNIDIGIPVRRLEYVFVHEDAPGEKVTIPHDVTSPPEGGKVEVFLEEGCPPVRPQECTVWSWSMRTILTPRRLWKS